MEPMWICGCGGKKLGQSLCGETLVPRQEKNGPGGGVVGAAQGVTAFF